MALSSSMVKSENGNFSISIPQHFDAACSTDAVYCHLNSLAGMQLIYTDTNWLFYSVMISPLKEDWIVTRPECATAMGD